MSTAPAIVPFDKRDGYIWMNGEIIAWGDARVHVLTHGLHYGSSIFEGERAYRGKIYHSRWHTERLFKSAEIMDFTIPYTIDEIEAAKALVLETARKRDRGEDVTMDVSMCKLYATEMCGRVADRVVQIFGGQGYVKESGIERFYRDVRAFRIYEGTSQIHQITIGKRLLSDAVARSLETTQ